MTEAKTEQGVRIRFMSAARACGRPGPLPAEDFADAAVTDPQLSGDVTRPDPLVGQLDYPLPDDVRQGSAVHKHPAELVHPAMPYMGYSRTEEQIQHYIHTDDTRALKSPYS